VGLAARYRLPAMYFEPQYVVNGGLVSYAPRSADFWSGAAAYVDKILKGEKSGDLPVQQPARYYLTVNLKTAKALDVTVPLRFSRKPTK
jgi:putative tryptophan/tyrosine transport system substrate-binding protein